MSFFIENHNSVEISEREVIDFLNKDPNFLLENSDKIHFFQSPKQDIFRLLNYYRNNNEMLLHKMHEFMDIARENYDTLNSLSDMSMILNQTYSIKEALSYICYHFKSEFSIPHVNFYYNNLYFDIKLDENTFKSEDLEDNIHFVEPKFYKKIFPNINVPVARERKCPLLNKLFPGAKVLSGLLLPLCLKSSLIGFLALGSDRKKRFRQSMNYDFLIRALWHISRDVSFLLSKRLFMEKPFEVNKEHLKSFLYFYLEKTPPVRQARVLMLCFEDDFYDLEELKKILREDDLVCPLAKNKMIIIPQGMMAQEWIKEEINHRLGGRLEDKPFWISVEDYVDEKE